MQIAGCDSDSECGAIPIRNALSEFWASNIGRSFWLEMEVVAGRRLAVTGLHGEAPGRRASSEDAGLLAESPALDSDDESRLLQLTEPANGPLRTAAEKALGFPLAGGDAASPFIRARALSSVIRALLPIFTLSSLPRAISV
jgi:hypothetical protein